MNAIDRPRRVLPNGVTISPLVVVSTGESYHGRRVWKLVKSLVLRLQASDGQGHITLHITVPAGFETDYASVPRLFWHLLPHDECAEAAVVHDWLYSHPDVDRHLADTILRLAMALTGKPKLMQWCFYLAVRFGGRWARKTRKANE